MAQKSPLVLLVVLLAGCRQSVDLSSVQTMAAGTKAATPSFEALANDYYQSCVRRIELKAIASNVRANFPERTQARYPLPAAPAYAPGLNPADLRTAPEATVERLAHATIAGFDGQQALALLERADFVKIETAFTSDQRTALQGALATANAGSIYSCAGAADVALQWRHRIDIYLGFYAALGSLAGGAASSDRYGINGLASSLQSAGVFANTSQTAAFQSLANVLVGHVFDWRRRDQLASDLARAQHAVDASTAQLTSVGLVNYKFQLRQERDALQEFRDVNLRLAAPGAQAFQVYRYAKQLLSDQDAVNTREQAADSYAASLKKLDAAYKDIVAAIAANNAGAAIAAAHFYYDDLHSDLGAVAKAFPGTN